MIPLGGPGVACSAMRVRRLAQGELAGDERARTEEHLARCGRCQGVMREVAEERARVAAELPFEAFAAGVAERLAAPAHGGSATGRLGRATARLGPVLALAAGLLLAAAFPVVLRVSREGASHRTKGGADVTVWVRDDGAPRVLQPGEPVPRRAALRIGLSPAGRRFAAVAVVDADGAAVLHAGAAAAGVLPDAFEWTGASGELVVVLDDDPIDAAALAERLVRGGAPAAAPGRGAEVIVRPLRRGEGP
jgi:hypothetical protein